MRFGSRVRRVLEGLLPELRRLRAERAITRAGRAEGFLGTPVGGEVCGQPPQLRLARRIGQEPHRVPENHLAPVRRERAELDLPIQPVGCGCPQALHDPLAVVGVDDLAPSVGLAEPAREGMPEEISSALRNETDDEGHGIRLPHECVEEVDEALERSLLVAAATRAPGARWSLSQRDPSKSRGRRHPNHQLPYLVSRRPRWRL